MKKIILSLMVITTLPFFSICQNKTGTFTDTRDGQTYRTVKIGKQWWMAENINFKTEESWCYDDNPKNCKTYGRLYTWEAAKSACPSGWHLPTDDEWKTLVDYLGGSAVAGGKMKEAYTKLWNSPNEGATNSSGFTAIPGGRRGSSDSFNDLGDGALFWAAQEYDNSYAWGPSLGYGTAEVRRGEHNKMYGRSVRCVKD